MLFHRNDHHPFLPGAGSQPAHVAMCPRRGAVKRAFNASSMLFLAAISVTSIVAPAEGRQAVTAQSAQSTPAATPPAAVALPDDSAGLAGFISTETHAVAWREEAARRLVVRRDDGSVQLAIGLLGNFTQRDVQLLVSRAIAELGVVDDRLIVPLNALLGPDRLLADAAATALANFKGSDTVTRLLISFATTPGPTAGGNDAARASVIRVLGTLAEKQVVATLVALVTDAQQPPAIRTAAADGLLDLTGQRALGRDPDRWAQWWDQRKDVTDVEWRAQLLQLRSARLDVIERQYTSLGTALEQLLGQQYRSASAEQRADTIARLLRWPNSRARLSALAVLYTEAAEGRPLDPATVADIRLLLTDPSAEVRRDAARVLGTINDAASLDVLLAQLQREQDTQARVAIARALAPIRDPRIIRPMLQLLGESPTAVAITAAETLRDLGPVVRESPEAPDAAIVLLTTLDRAAGSPNPEIRDLRAACVEALAPLRDRSAAVVYQRLLSRDESPRTRRAALRALADLRIPDTAPGIIAALDDATDEPGVRLEAVNALGAIPTFDHAETLYRRLDANAEQDASVRQRAWEVLQQLLPLASRTTLESWLVRFESAPDRQIAVLKVIEQKLVAETATNPSLAGDLADRRLLLAECLLRAGQPADAEACLAPAWAFFSKEPGLYAAYVERTVARRIEALLLARTYTAAVSFAAAATSLSKSHLETIGLAVRDEAQRLESRGDDDAALSLITTFTAPASPLDSRMRDMLERIATRLEPSAPPPSSTTAPSLPRTPPGFIFPPIPR